ncbi:50S ribosomal protein L11 methyltransferase [candidate division KSB1 bacterium]|nr:50S ribosomal protein L11 methyltransferase [candidate division KSB1 bacterium]
MKILKPKNNWVEISLPVSDQVEDAVTNFLFELGAAGSSIREDLLSAYFQESVWTKQKHEQLIHYLHQLNELDFFVRTDQIQVQIIENQDWNAIWKQSIKPIDIDGKILIKPSWIDIKPSPNMHIIEIDPQMAFGTGTHATTQLMLKFIIEHIGKSFRIIDIGTGTGILAMAAARLSEASIIAFDNDPIAAATAQQNIQKNHVQEKIHLFCGTLDTIKKIQFDLVLANINRTTIVPMLSDIYDKMKASGLAILSGILIEEKSEITKHLNRFPLKIVAEKQIDEWIGLVIQKK